MADFEKPEETGMNNTEDSQDIKEGGDTQAAPEKKVDQTPVKPKTISELDDLDEESEYSEEEYQRFVDLYERTLSEINEGQIVMGRVLAVTNQDVLVDIGFKSEGTVPVEEFNDPSEIKVGDQIEVFLETIEDSDGQLVLSKRKANFMRLWDRVVDTYNEGGTIEGTCVRRIKGGIVVDLLGVDAFLPGSQIDVKPIRDFDTLIGKTFTFRIVKVNRLRKNIVVSRRSLLEESMKEQRSKVLDDIEKGMVFEGSVKNITDFGVFVDLGGVDGLLHINDLSWGRVKHPSEVVGLDQKIKVVVLDFNDAKDRISLGLKQLQPHPWEGIEAKYPEGSVISGKIVSIADYGAFVELECGVEGLIHVSEMSWTRHGIHPSKIVNVGETVEVKVLNIDQERKRISLGLKQLTPDPWENIEEKYPKGLKYTGRVRNMTNFGVFIEMEEGIDGLIHISDLSWTKKVKHPSEILKKGEEVEVIVLEVNKDERRVSLGYKQLTEDPWPEFEKKYQADTVVPAAISRFVDKGLVVELESDVEGFVPLSQLTESNLAKVQQQLKEGQKIDLAVIEFDKENKRIVLSQKRVDEMSSVKQTREEQADIAKYMNNQGSGTTLADVAGDSIKNDESSETEEKKPAKKAKPKAKAEKAESKEDEKEDTEEKKEDDDKTE